MLMVMIVGCHQDGNGERPFYILSREKIPIVSFIVDVVPMLVGHRQQIGNCSTTMVGKNTLENRTRQTAASYVRGLNLFMFILIVGVDIDTHRPAVNEDKGSSEGRCRRNPYDI